MTQMVIDITQAGYAQTAAGPQTPQPPGPNQAYGQAQNNASRPGGVLNNTMQGQQPVNSVNPNSPGGLSSSFNNMRIQVVITFSYS